MNGSQHLKILARIDNPQETFGTSGSESGLLARNLWDWPPQLRALIVLSAAYGDTVKTFTPKPSDIEREWFVVDAEGLVLGRMATEVARILRGKHKPIFAPHADTGDHVIVINADKIVLTGKKLTDKMVYRHSGYPGGLTTRSYGDLLKEKPADTVRKSITGMLPHNRLGAQMATKLKVYAGAEHPHTAQKPNELVLANARAARAEDKV